MASPLIEKSHGWFRSWFQKVWKVRGGGLYAVGFAISFAIFEIQSLADDVLGIGALFSGQAFEFVINFFIDSLKNTIAAFMWPLYIVQWQQPVGAILLGLAFWLFPSYLKKPIENWMFDGELEEVEEPDKQDSA